MNISMAFFWKLSFGVCLEQRFPLLSWCLPVLIGAKIKNKLPRKQKENEEKRRTQLLDFDLKN
ncbi:hypothetical protein [Paenibacillus macerans]|uniref:hypothetical protein n=1 Tax=Paenibacillus macerans TaxID=44252 RepID=UPI001D131D72|nr:hypothetical protein [Paenibacillus macerans]